MGFDSSSSSLGSTAVIAEASNALRANISTASLGDRLKEIRKQIKPFKK